MIAGFDISTKNGNVVWDNISNTRLKFVFLKSGDGLYNADPQYTFNCQNAQKRGFLVGAYHWLNPKFDCKQQAENFVKTVGSFKGLLPPVVCLESYRTILFDMERNVRLFIDTLTNLTGRKAMIYTSLEYWKTYLPDVEWADTSLLWIDHPGNLYPPQVYPWAGWTFWQSSYQVLLPGVNDVVGFNWFNGTLKDLSVMIQ